MIGALNTLIIILVALLPFERIPSVDVSIFGLQMVTLRLSLLAGLSLVTLSLATILTKRLPLDRRWTWIWLAAFLTSSTVGSLISGDANHSLLITGGIGLVAATAYSINLFLRPQYIKPLIITILASSTLVGVFALYQFFGDTFGLSNTITGLRAHYAKTVFGFPRIQATALEPLYFANFLLVPTTLAIILATLRKKLSAYAIFWLLATCCFLTLSRGGVIALLACTALATALIIKIMGWRVGLIAPVMLVVSFATTIGIITIGGAIDVTATTTSNTTNYSAQLSNFSEGESVISRAEGRQLAIEAFTKNPILGLGAGEFGDYAYAQRPDIFSDNQGVVNNETLELLAEHGLIGFVLFSLFIMSLWLAGWRSVISSISNPTLSHILTWSILIGLIGIAIQYQSFSTLYIMHIWVWIGILGALSKQTKQVYVQ